MNNLIFEKVWEDETVIELEITAVSSYVTAHQRCYVSSNDIQECAKKISSYIDNPLKSMYIHFGNKEGNCTPAFSMELLEMDKKGCVKFEVDIEIDDIENRSHRCKYFVESEFGAVERFGKQLSRLCEGTVGTSIEMYDN